MIPLLVFKNNRMVNYASCQKRVISSPFCNIISHLDMHYIMFYSLKLWKTSGTQFQCNSSNLAHQGTLLL